MAPQENPGNPGNGNPGNGNPGNGNPGNGNPGNGNPGNGKRIPVLLPRRQTIQRVSAVFKALKESEICSVVSESVTPWIIQTMEFSRPESCSG